MLDFRATGQVSSLRCIAGVFPITVSFKAITDMKGGGATREGAWHSLRSAVLVTLASNQLDIGPSNEAKASNTASPVSHHTLFAIIPPFE